MNINVTKQELLAAIGQHRAHHHSRLASLRMRYQRYLIQALEHALQQAKADLHNPGSSPLPTFLAPPTDHTATYDDLTASLAAHSDDAITLPQDEYTTIIDDRRAWHAEYHALDARLTEHGV